VEVKEARWRTEGKNEEISLAPNPYQRVLSTFPREGPVRVINENLRRENRHSSLLHRQARCQPMLRALPRAA